MRIFSRMVSICAAVTVFPSIATPAFADESTLETMKKRGELHCGVNGLIPGFSAPSDNKQLAGLEIDICRAIAAAVLGDASKARFVEVVVGNRFEFLLSKKIDVLFRNTIPTLERTVGTGVRDAAIYYFDGQAVAIRKQLGVKTLTELNGRSICVLDHTPYGRTIRDWFRYQKLNVELVTFETQKETLDAFLGGKCDALTQQISALSTTIIASGHASDYLVLPEILANNPVAAFVRACPYRKLHPTIFMMKPAENGPRAELAELLNWSIDGRVLFQG